MSTQYPVLDSRPIDQWKVTELKEELKRRKLTTKGLKDDLIKRLDEALRDEMDSKAGDEAIDNEKESSIDEETDNNEKESSMDEKTDNNDKESSRGEAVHNDDSAKEDAVNGFGGTVEPQSAYNVVEVESNKIEITVDIEDTVDIENKVNATKVDIDGTPNDVSAESAKIDMVEDIRIDGENQNQNQEVDADATKVDIDGSPDDSDLLKFQDGSMVAKDSTNFAGQTIALSVETKTTVSETVVVQISSNGQDSQNSETRVEIEDPKLPQEDAVLNVSNSNNQVSEVSPVLGFPVNSESISTEKSVSINEKNKLKDNLNADNSILELEVVKPEMVQPSSSDVPFEGGDVHPMDEQVPHENQSSIEEVYDINATNAGLSRKNYSADGGSSEKLNLDRSSGDDSMEEDILESKAMDSNHKNDEVGDEKDVPVVKKGRDGVEQGLSFGKHDNPVNSVSVPAEKRKPEDHEVAVNNEPVKRQRRWNSETVKIPEPQASNTTISTTPKDTVRSTFPKRNFTRSDSSLSGGDTLKERIVPPPLRPPTTSLRINNFLRPFTLKAVQELLAKTGTVSSFWMDHIKTHCYVTYLSAEEAIETRNALYNLQWPVNGGKLLVAEFVDPQEVKQAELSSQPSVAPVSTTPNKPSAPSPFQPSPRHQDLKPRQQELKPSPRQQDPKPSPRQQDLRQQLPPPPPHALPPPPPLSDSPAARERLNLPPPPPLPRKPDPPIVTLDDLFKKTKATPRIYYLPLSEEQVAAKLSVRGKNIKK